MEDRRTAAQPSGGDNQTTDAISQTQLEICPYDAEFKDENREDKKPTLTETGGEKFDGLEDQSSRY